MFNFYSQFTTICPICREGCESYTIRCPNCRTRLRVRNNRNDRFNINHIIGQFNLNIFPENNSVRKFDAELVKEKLEVKRMTKDLCLSKTNNLEKKICCICQYNIEFEQEIYLLSCNHLFHTECADKWFKEKSECPYCRKQFNFIYK